MLRQYSAVFASLVMTVLMLSGNGAWAIEFPERNNSNTDIIVIDDADVDYAIRNHLISQAKHSVEMINFSHGADKIGLGLAKSIRQASMNGARVRYAFEGLVSKYDGDPTGKIAKLLSDNALTRPAEIITAKFIEKLKSGLSLSDFIHEKLIIIDAGTPNETIIIGGRGASNFSEQSLDTGYIIRPVDHTQPYAGTDFKAMFENFWTIMSSMYNRTLNLPVKPALLAEINGVAAEYPVPANDQANYNELRRLVAKTPTVNDLLSPNQFRPAKIQLISNDFFESVVAGQSPKSFFVRPELQENPVVKKVSSIVSKSKKVQLSAYTYAPPPLLEGALVSAIKKEHAQVDIFTNGREAHSRMSGMGYAVDYTSLSYLQLAKRSAAKKDQLNIHLFDPQAETRADADAKHPIYFHRKLLVADDTVVAGSDNFTVSSATKNNEFVLVMEDPRMSKAMTQQNETEAAKVFTVASKGEIRKDLKTTHWFSRVCMPLIRMLY